MLCVTASIDPERLASLTDTPSAHATRKRESSDEAAAFAWISSAVRRPSAQFCSLHDQPGAQLRELRQRLAKRLWIVCLGYRRHRYELEPPRAPIEAVPLDDALDLANTCLNGIGFLAED